MTVFYKKYSGNLLIEPIIRTKEELFSTTVAREFKNGYSVIINANFYDITLEGGRDAYFGHDPVPAKETLPNGYIVFNKKKVLGKSDKNFYIAFDNTKMKADGSGLLDAFSSGGGNPPTNVYAAFGGLGPLIINGLKYGNTNLYKEGAPKDAPLTGDPGDKARPYLIQKSASIYSSFMKKDAEVEYRMGKACIGVSKTHVYIYVQSHGHSPGASLTAIRNSLLKEGCKHAVFFDGSDSVLVYDSIGFVIGQAEDKDETCVVGLGLKYTPKPAEKK
ncbi:MAG: hypothetical protein ACK5KL_20400 [Dysgonomonas sp.]